MKDKLTIKQKRFCDEYLKTGNGMQSAITAGYSKSSAGAISVENLNKPLIKEYLEAHLNKEGNEAIASADEILKFLTDVVRGVIKEDTYTKDGNELIESKTAKVSERTKAAELLGKRYRLFVDKIEVDANVESVVEYIVKPVEGDA